MAQGVAESDSSLLDDTDNDSHVVIVVARHGERQDYIERDSGGNWVAQAERPWDPPLSAHGMTQGYKLGRHLVTELQRLGLPPVARVYSSPWLRCRQTAAQARQGLLSHQAEADDDVRASVLRVRIEMGLVESINENWYRSWGMQGVSDGTWGCRSPLNTSLDPHPRATQPVQALLAEWRLHYREGPKKEGVDSEQVAQQFDLAYESHTQIVEPYTFVPRHMETDDAQRERMRRTVTGAALQQQASDGTVMFVSHGAPVVHLFAALTGRHDHGSSSYCCYSIYRVSRRALQCQNEDSSDEPPLRWEAIQVNQAEYLNEDIVREKHV